MMFAVPGGFFGGQNGVEKGVQNVASTLKATESLLNGSWSALGSLWGREKVAKTAMHGEGPCSHRGGEPPLDESFFIGF